MRPLRFCPEWDPTKEVMEKLLLWAGKEKVEIRRIDYRKEVIKVPFIIVPSSETKFTLWFKDRGTRKINKKIKHTKDIGPLHIVIPYKVWANDPFLLDLKTWLEGPLPTYRFTIIPKEKLNDLYNNRCRRHRATLDATGESQ